MGMILLLVLLLQGAAADYNDTEDFWKCEGKVGGAWKFGVAPYACNGATFGPDAVILDNLQPFIFNTEAESLTDERKYYVSNMIQLIKGISKIYLQARKPASEEEVKAWSEAMLTVSHQESFISHYRHVKDQPLKYMRGDFGHGHGLMQVDDRWHFQAVTDLKGWSLIDNLYYSMDMLYEGWQKAAQANCVSSTTNWPQRSYAMYSYYNGGPSKLCRFSNPDDRWSRNDNGFKSKLTSKAWESYQLAGMDKLPIECLSKKQFPCLTSDEGVQFNSNTLYVLTDNRVCYKNDENINCIESEKNIQCLKSLTGIETVKSYSLNIENTVDQHSSTVCNTTANTFKIGDSIEPQKNINLRLAPGGERLDTVLKHQSLQVLDVVVTGEDLSRYYKVFFKNSYGYIYAGTESSAADWATEGDPLPAEQQIIITQPSLATVQNDNGIKTKDLHYKKDEQVYIEDFKVKGENNEIYYSINGEEFYSGRLLPFNSTHHWLTKVTGETVTASDQFYYQWLSTCPDQSCRSYKHFVVGGKLEALCHKYRCAYKKDSLYVLEKTAGWVRVYSLRLRASGWLREEFVNYEQ